MKVLVFLVDKDGVVINSRDPGDLGSMGGDIVEFAKAQLPGGCGKTEHCSACTIRNAITETYETGRAVVARPGFQTVTNNGTDEQVRIRVWTVKTGDGVLLRVEDSDDNSFRWGPSP